MNEYDRYQCDICNYIYDPEYGDPEAGEDALPGTPFQDLPDDWICPHCGAEKEAADNERNLPAQFEPTPLSILPTHEYP